jgi:hypothetical protein
MLQAMEHLARLPQTTKIWRPFVLDKFNDAGLFNLRNGVVRQSWIRLFSALLSNDKERIVDLLGKKKKNRMTEMKLTKSLLQIDHWLRRLQPTSSSVESRKRSREQLSCGGCRSACSSAQRTSIWCSCRLSKLELLNSCGCISATRL